MLTSEEYYFGGQLGQGGRGLGLEGFFIFTSFCTNWLQLELCTLMICLVPCNPERTWFAPG